MLRKGDVITFPYVGLDHEGVITEMTPLSDNLSEVVKVTEKSRQYQQGKMKQMATQWQ
jgi:hypothetical protein